MKKLLSILLVLLLSCGALAEHMGAPYEFRESHVTAARIASGVTEIAEGAYYYCKELKTLEVPATVTSIGDYAFDHCENLTELTIPNSVREIGECAFNYCMRIASLDLGNGVKTLGSYAFSCCFSLRQATIPQSVTSIGDYAFYNCRALDTLYIYGSVKSIGTAALEGCPRLTVYTPATSFAAAYCTQNGIKWVAIEEPEVPALVECNIYGTSHQYEFIPSDLHPHGEFKCACGAVIENDIIKSLSCCQCGYHAWGAPQHVGNLRYKQVCTRGCGATRDVTAPAQQLAADKFIQNVIYDRGRVSYIPRSDKSDSIRDYSVAVLCNGTWKLVAEASSDYGSLHELRHNWETFEKKYKYLYNATDVGIMYKTIVGLHLDSFPGSFNYAGDVSSDAINNVDGSKILRKEDLPETSNSSAWLSLAYGATDQLTDVWYVTVNEFLNTFSDQVESISKAIGKPTTEEAWYNEKVELWKNVLSDMLTHTYDTSFSLTRAKTAISHAKNTFDVWDNVAMTAGKNASWLAKYKIDPKILASIKARAIKLEIHSATDDWTKFDAYTRKFGWGCFEAVFAILESFCAGAEAKEKVLEDQKDLAIMILEDRHSIDRLQNIIDATNNRPLRDAAEQMIFDIEAESKKKSDAFWATIHAILNWIEVQAADFSAAGETLFYKIGDHYLGASLPALGVISLLTSVGKSALNWGASYESAKELMTYSVMESELNAIGALANCNSLDAMNDIAQLWYSLQINGTLAAKQFTKDYDAGIFLHIAEMDLIIDNAHVTSASYLVGKLDAEITRYKREAQSFASACNQ